MDHLQSRRKFLKFVSSQTTVLGLSPLIINSISGCVSSPDPRPFNGLKPSRRDEFQLVDGLNSNVLIRWGQKINKAGETFGFNNDFTCFLPFEKKLDEGLLWVNHESVIPQFIHNKNTSQLTRSINEIIK